MVAIAFAPPPVQPVGSPKFIDPNDIAMRSALAAELSKSGDGIQDIRSPWQGLAQVFSAGAGAYQDQKATQDKETNAKLLADVLGGAASGQELSSDKLSMVFALDPQLGMSLAQQQQAKRDAAASDAQKAGELERAAEALSAQGMTREADALRNGLIGLDDVSALLTKSWEAPKPPDLPADVDTYNWYAQGEQAAGRQPMSFLDFQQAQKGNGFSVTMPDGTVVQQGGPQKPLTEGQSKDVIFGTRAAGALPTIDALGDRLTSLGENLAGNAGPFAGYMQSDEYQQADNAGREFLAALLRKDSGATITPQEMQNYGAIYLPQPGDKPGVLAQKKSARARAVAAIKLGLPAQAVAAMEGAGVTMPDLPAQPGITPPGGTVEAPGTEVTAINPTTGEKLKLVNGQWVPF